MILDSVIVIDVLNGVAVAAEFVRGIKDVAIITPVTRAEVIAGFAELSDAGPAIELFDYFRWIDLTPPICDLAASLRRTARLRLPDAFQAAAALHHGVPLATRNTKDFDRRRFPFVQIPYRV